MFIRVGIVRDHVKDHVKAALAWATAIRVEIARDYVRAHFNSWDYQGLCQSYTYQSRVNQITIVRDHIRATLVTVEC